MTRAIAGADFGWAPVTNLTFGLELIVQTTDQARQSAPEAVGGLSLDCQSLQPLRDDGDEVGVGGSPFAHPHSHKFLSIRAPLLHEVGKVARSAGWGGESRNPSTKLGNDGRAMRPLVQQVDHPSGPVDLIPEPRSFQQGGKGSRL